MQELTRIGNKHNTDKGTVAYEKHGYTEEYGKIIPNTGKYKLLEVGVWRGDSIKMWTEYNPDMEVTGIDIDPNCLNYIPKTSFSHYIYIGDAGNKKFMDVVIEESAPWDFIIDDGSHRYEDILAAFSLLWPEVKKGGYYFIEDLHAGQARREEVIKQVLNQLESPYEVQWSCNGKLMTIQKQ